MGYLLQHEFTKEVLYIQYNDFEVETEEAFADAGLYRIEFSYENLCRVNLTAIKESLFRYLSKEDGTPFPELARLVHNLLINGSFTGESDEYNEKEICTRWEWWASEIKFGDTPDNSIIAKMTRRWLEEFLQMHNAN